MDKYEGSLPQEQEFRKTLEFRAHKSSINGSEIVKWVKLCTRLVSFAYTVDGTKLDPLLREYIDEKVRDFCIVKLLKAIGQPELGFCFGMKLAQEDGIGKRKRKGKGKGKGKQEKEQKNTELGGEWLTQNLG